MLVSKRVPADIESGEGPHKQAADTTLSQLLCITLSKLPAWQPMVIV